MISHQYKSIFVHIPKTAGTSVEHKLGYYQEDDKRKVDHTTIREIEPIGVISLLKSLSKNHEYYSRFSFIRIAAQQWMKPSAQLSKSQYENYYKFAFVRNPWARVHSWYYNVMKDLNLMKILGVEVGCSFKEYLNLHLNQWGLRPQLYWLVDRRGNIPFDFIGKFENLRGDFSKVCDVLGIENCELPVTRFDAKKVHYSEMYDDQMKAIVAKKYAEEIALFEYKFGD